MVTRIVLLALASFLLPTLGQAQTRFGVSGEVNRSSFGGVAPQNAAYSANYGSGFAGIVELRVHSDVVLSFQPGWIQKGAKIVFNKDVFEDVDLVYQFTVGYLHDFGGYGGFLETRYMQGMATINNTNQTTVGNIYVADFKSNGLRLVAGVLF